MDNLRTNVSITSRAEMAFNSLEDEFAYIYSKRDFVYMISTIKGVRDTSAKRVNYMPKLYNMLEECEIPFEKDKDISYYENLIEKELDDERYGAQSVEERMVFTLFDLYENYTNPSEYMERIVSRLIKEEDAKKWNGASLRLRILKQFIKYGNYLKAAGYKGRTQIEEKLKEKRGNKKYTTEEAADLVDESIFEYIDDPDIKSSEKKTTYGLMKLADDLAKGKFRTNGATKKGLYLFAMVYRMTIPGFPGANDNNDVIKNLFRDYYNNNLMTYLNKEYRNHLREFETDPSGQGVNFKNFAEMIFLYYIVKDMDPAEKISKSYTMIDKVTEEAKNFNFKNVKKETFRNTGYYKVKLSVTDDDNSEIIFSETIFSKNEEKFKQFLLENYDCDVRTGRVHESKGKTIEETTPPMLMDIDQNTAYEKYSELMKQLKDELSEKGMNISDCNYGLWFDDVSAYKKAGLKKYTDMHSEIDKERFDDFMEILIGANSFIGKNVYEDESNRSLKGEKAETTSVIKALSITSAREITRTSLMVAFYYYFNCKEEDMRWTSYGELYDAFKEELDPYLISAGYQTLSSKSIFDVLLTFSSYARNLSV